MRKKVLLLLLFFGFLAILSACKKSETTGNTDNSVGGTDNNQPPTIGLSVGDIAPNFTEIDSQGNEMTLESFRGNVILLTFSTMWCGPCRKEAPELIEVYNTYNERGLEIVQCIYEDENRNPADRDDLGRWINQYDIPFTVFNDPDRSTVDAYRFNRIPFNVIIDRDFVIRYLTIGFFPEEIRHAIENLL